MINFSANFKAKGNGQKTLERYQAGLRNLRPLGDSIAKLVVEGNRIGSSRGWDIDENPYAHLKKVSWRGRKGYGPPLAPRLNQSRIIKNFRYKMTVNKDSISLKFYWVNCPWIKYHQTGTKHMARRDPVGIRPMTRKKLQSACNRHFGYSQVSNINISTNLG